MTRLIIQSSVDLNRPHQAGRYGRRASADIGRLYGDLFGFGIHDGHPERLS